MNGLTPSIRNLLIEMAVKDAADLVAWGREHSQMQKWLREPMSRHDQMAVQMAFQKLSRKALQPT